MFYQHWSPPGHSCGQTLREPPQRASTELLQLMTSKSGFYFLSTSPHVCVFFPHELFLENKHKKTYRLIYICGAGIKSSVFTHRVKQKSVKWHFPALSPPLTARERSAYQAPSQTSHSTERVFSSPRQAVQASGVPLLCFLSCSFNRIADTCLGGSTLGFRLALLLAFLSRVTVLWLAVAEH